MSEISEFIETANMYAGLHFTYNLKSARQYRKKLNAFILIENHSDSRGTYAGINNIFNDRGHIQRKFLPRAKKLTESELLVRLIEGDF